MHREKRSTITTQEFNVKTRKSEEFNIKIIQHIYFQPNKIMTDTKFTLLK